MELLRCLRVLFMCFCRLFGLRAKSPDGDDANVDVVLVKRGLSVFDGQFLRREPERKPPVGQTHFGHVDYSRCEMQSFNGMALF